MADFGLSVAAASQGHGIGTALIVALLDVADGWLGLRRIQLSVLTGNERARGLYERHGFAVEGRLRGYVISEGVLRDVWVMARVRPAPEVEPAP